MTAGDPTNRTMAWLRSWWRRHVWDDDPMDDELRRWEHRDHCTDPTCPCQPGRRDAC